jgi:Uma2 family endonuclease
MNIRILPEIYYPESDGKPMAETPIHMLVMWDAIQMLIAWFAINPRVYVWGNMFLYYVEGDWRKSVSPDVMVIKGVDKDRPRNVFKVWDEGSSPCVTIEVSSRKTRAEDVKKKFELYQNVLKVHEYYLFDPNAEYLKPPLKGYRLHDDIYRPIEAIDGRLPSEELGLHLERHGTELRLWNPATKRWLPTPEEALEQQKKAYKLEKKARTQEERAHAQEKQARIHAEAENEQLRRELAALRKKKGAE